MIRDEVSISLETYTIVLKKENLGDPHPTLGGGELWYSEDEMRTRDARVLGELRAQGLVQGTRASDDFLETLAIMQRASVEYYTFATIEGRPVRIRTAAQGRDAVLVVRDGDRITVSPIPAEQLAVRLVAALPSVPAAHLHSMSCDLADLQAVLTDKDLPTSSSVSDAKRMKRWMQREQVSSGYLYAAVRTGLGRRTASTPPLPIWFDTEAGRVLLRPASNGWVNLLGADLLTLAATLDELEKDLRG